MIIENRSSEIGDIIYIKAEVPIIGLLALVDFYDQTVGETSQKNFERKFRYSLDGINWSTWIILTLSNIQSIIVQPTNVFYIEYQYKRVGTDSSGELTFNENTLETEKINPTCGSVYQNSIFGEYFSCYSIELLQWCLNVTEKLYSKGIIPNYLKRGETGNLNNIDEDYLAFWRTVACFFAIFVTYARLFENFENLDIFEKYLAQQDLSFFSETNIFTLQKVMNKFFENFYERGTLAIIKDATNSNDIDGELKRLIGFDKTKDEFLFALYPNKKSGWNINNSSPIYKGTYFLDQYIKGYEKQKEILDLNKYPLNNSSFINTINVVGKGKVMQMHGLSNNKVGIGEGTGASWSEIEEFGIVIDPKVDYEITFWVKEFSTSGDSRDFLSFGAIGYNEAGSIVSLEDLFGSNTNYFSEKIHLNSIETWYFVRGIIFGVNRDSLNLDTQTNLKKGKNLKFKENIVKIIPFLWYDASWFNLPLNAGNKYQIWDFKIRPNDTLYSTGFIQRNELVHIWLNNKNKKYLNYSEDFLYLQHPYSLQELKNYPELKKMIREKFLNINTPLITNWL